MLLLLLLPGVTEVGVHTLQHEWEASGLAGERWCMGGCTTPTRQPPVCSRLFDPPCASPPNLDKMASITVSAARAPAAAAKASRPSAPAPRVAAFTGVKPTVRLGKATPATFGASVAASVAAPQVGGDAAAAPRNAPAPGRLPPRSRPPTPDREHPEAVGGPGREPGARGGRGLSRRGPHPPIGRLAHLLAHAHTHAHTPPTHAPTPPPPPHRAAACVARRAAARAR